MENEIWKDIKGYEGIYQVSNFGRVKSLERVNSRGNTVKERILKPHKTEKGYLHIVLCKDGKTKLYRVHRLVATYFIPNPENKPEVDHINGQKDDNRVENLRWVTSKENINNPTTKKKMKYRIKTAIHCGGMIFPSITACAEYYGIPINTMGKWLRGEHRTPQKFIDLGLRYATEQEVAIFMQQIA